MKGYFVCCFNITSSKVNHLWRLKIKVNLFLREESFMSVFQKFLQKLREIVNISGEPVQNFLYQHLNIKKISLKWVLRLLTVSEARFTVVSAESTRFSQLFCQCRLKMDILLQGEDQGVFQTMNCYSRVYTRRRRLFLQSRK